MENKETILREYEYAFTRRYPGKKMEMKPGRGGYYVIIDGDKGEKPLSVIELRFAIENFNRGM